MLQAHHRVFVAGHRGMVGAAILRLMRQRAFGVPLVRSREELDLREQTAVRQFFAEERPDAVILAAARVGGIQANINSPADFLHDNLEIQNHLIHEASRIGVKAFCFLGSSCIYPKQAPQPISEEHLLTGPLEPTNEGYALAKIAGLRMVEFYGRQYGMPGLSLMPCNLYGTNDHYDLKNSHVMSATIKKFVDAVREGREEVTMWGTGVARREFMHVDDCAEAVLHFMERGIGGRSFINIGVGEDVSIRELAGMIATETGFCGRILWDDTKSDGMLRKLMNVSQMRELGFAPKIALRDGIRRSIQEYRQLIGE